MNRRVQRSLAARTIGFALLVLLVQPVVQAGREFREYPGLEADAAAPLPPDYQVPAEFVVGRLMFPGSLGFGWFGGGDWTQGGTAWAILQNGTNEANMACR